MILSSLFVIIFFFGNSQSNKISVIYDENGPLLHELRNKLRNKSLIFIGDSLTRYQYLNLVGFLHTGYWKFEKPLSEWEKEFETWEEFFHVTSSRLGENEICDCHREHRVYNLDDYNIRENRVYRDNVHNFSISLYLHFPDFPILINSDFKKPGLFGTLESYRSISHTHVYKNILDFLNNFIVHLHPSILVFNQGFWLKDLPLITEGDGLLAFINAMKSSCDLPIWKTTTSTLSMNWNYEIYFPYFISNLTANGIEIFDAYAITEKYRNHSHLYFDQVHFHPVAYKDLNMKFILQFYKNIIN